MPTYWSTGKRMYSDSERPSRTHSSGSSTGTFTRSAHRRLLGNTSPDISSMVTMRVEVSASAVAAEVEEALARVERARLAACARNDAASRRVHASARARGEALACAARAALIADIARVVRARLPSRNAGRGVRPGRVGLCARETRCVCVCADSITFFRGAGPGARGDSDRARLESHERAIVAR
jgi:hypothetical protein